MEESLLEKLGGEVGITKIVDEYYKRALEDPRIQNRYTKADLEEIKRKETSFLMQLVKKEAGYVEGALIPTNAGPAITKAEFNLVVSIYEDVAKEQGASTSTASQLAEVLNSVRNEVEGH